MINDIEKLNQMYDILLAKKRYYEGKDDNMANNIKKNIERVVARIEELTKNE